jgi:hypothetical protein
VPENPAEEWDPWTDGDPAYDILTSSPPQSQKQLTDLQRVADEMAQSTGYAPYQETQMAQISVPKKKYSHLPLIADELKEDAEHRAEHDGAGSRWKKKGTFGFK